MDVYYINNGNGNYTYCSDCVDHFLKQGGNANTIDGPYPNGGGEADLIHHCDRGVYCKSSIHTIFGPKGACFYNDLTEAEVSYTIDALAAYVDQKDGMAEILDLWAHELRSYTLSLAQVDVLCEYQDARSEERKSFNNIVNKVPDDQLIPPKNQKKQDNKVYSLMAFFDDRPTMSDTVYCKSCKDTGIIVLFNSSVECTDCAISKSEIKCI